MASFPTIVPNADVAQDAISQFQDFATQHLQNFVQTANNDMVQPALDDFQSYASGLIGGLGKAPDDPLMATPDDQRTQATAAAVANGADPANLAWARANMGKAEYQNLCEQFVENASGKTGQFPTALAAAQSSPLATDWSKARPGDTVYYGAAPENGGYGHAAIYSGNGNVVSSAANHETPLTGYFNAPLLGYRPGTDNQQRDPSPVPVDAVPPAPEGQSSDPIANFKDFAGNVMSQLGSSVQQGLTGMREAATAPGPQVQAAVQGAPQAILSAASDPLTAAVGGINAVNAASGGPSPAPAPAEAAQPTTVPASQTAATDITGQAWPGPGDTAAPLLTPQQASAAQIMGGVTAGGPEGLAAPLAAGTDVVRAGIKAVPSLADAAARTVNAIEASPGVPAVVANAITDLRAALDRLPPVEAAGSGPGAARAGGNLGSNLNAAHLPEDVVPALDATYGANAGAIDAARRGVISDTAAKDLAQATGQSVDDIVAKWKPGDAANEETMIALRNAMVDRTRAAQAAQDAWQAEPTAANNMARMSADAAASNMQTVVQGLTAEAGRALRAIGIDVTDPLVLAKLADNPDFVANIRNGAPGAALPEGIGGKFRAPHGDLTVEATPQAQDMLPGLEPPGFVTDPASGASLGRPDRPFAAEPGTAADIADLTAGTQYPMFQGKPLEVGALPDRLGPPNPAINSNDLLNKVAAASAPLRTVQNVLKQTLVSASVFHPLVEQAQLGRTFLSQGSIAGGARALANADRAFFSSSFLKDYMQANRFAAGRAEASGTTLLRGELGPDVGTPLFKSAVKDVAARSAVSGATSAIAGYGSAKAQGESDADALKRGLLFGAGGVAAGALSRPLNQALWGRFVPVAKLEAWKLLEKKYGADAAANSVNNTFGGQNLAKYGRSQNVQDIIRTVFLAPDWLESWVRNLGATVKPGPEGDIARRYWVATLGAGAVTMEGLNMAFNGHLTQDNEPGHHFELETTGLLKMLGQNPARRTYLDMLSLGPVGSALNAADRGDAGAFARSHLNVIPSAVSDAIQNKTAGGKQIVADKTPPPAAVGPEIAAAASHAVPIGLSGFENTNLPLGVQAFSGVTGMRSSEGQPYSAKVLQLYAQAAKQPPVPTADLTIKGVGHMTLTQSEQRSLASLQAPVYDRVATRLAANPRWATLKPEQQQKALDQIDTEVHDALLPQFLKTLGRDRIVAGVKAYQAATSTADTSKRAWASGWQSGLGDMASKLGTNVGQRLPQFTAPKAA